VKFRYVAANFKIPTVTCASSNSKASFRVGIDGYGNKTVEQDGIASTGSYHLTVEDLTRSRSFVNQPGLCPHGYTCGDVDAEAILEAANGANLSRSPPVPASMARSGKQARGIWLSRS